VPRTFNLCLLGFGNVGRALLELLLEKRDALRSEHGIEWRITGVATRRMGWIASPAGLDPKVLLEGSVSPPSLCARPAGVPEWLRAAQADVLFENTSLDFETGEPAISHLRAALEHGAHAITANKGPVVHAYKELSEVARRHGRRFLFESTVMDGVPIFSMFRDTLPLVEVTGFRGVLNSTTNVILGGMEAGKSFADSLRDAQVAGVAETDPAADIDGWDAAVKVAALALVLMKYPLKPQQVERHGIRHLTGESVRAAVAAGRRCKLVCEAERSAAGIRARVGPEEVSLADALARVEGTSSAITFYTDVFPALTLFEENPGPKATAYGLLADFITAVCRADDSMAR
jgi:homoserine dehydrogenase